MKPETSNLLSLTMLLTTNILSGRSILPKGEKGNVHFQQLIVPAAGVLEIFVNKKENVTLGKKLRYRLA